jgi:hypothetical protein
MSNILFKYSFFIDMQVGIAQMNNKDLLLYLLLCCLFYPAGSHQIQAVDRSSQGRQDTPFKYMNGVFASSIDIFPIS